MLDSQLTKGSRISRLHHLYDSHPIHNVDSVTGSLLDVREYFNILLQDVCQLALGGLSKATIVMGECIGDWR